MAQLALAWCLKNQNVSSVITGASKPEQIMDNVKSLHFIKDVSSKVMTEIDEGVGERIIPDPARQS